jgi:cholesterol transport system auxiliary component
MRIRRTLLQRALGTLAAVPLCILGISCSSLTQPSPDKALFAIDPGKPPATATPPPATDPSTQPAAAVLQVHRLRVASPYDGLEFVYRTGADQFQIDYYNGFVAPPDQMLSAALSNWIANTGLFKAVVDMGSGVPARLTLDGSIIALDGDYTSQSVPKAQMKLRVLLVENAAGRSLVIWQKEYDAATPISAGSPQELVNGWDRDLRSILGRVTADLAAQCR